jgi:hypothetical protein
MAYMTEEEADALDEELTRTTPKADFSKPDIFYPPAGTAYTARPHDSRLHHDLRS